MVARRTKAGRLWGEKAAVRRRGCMGEAKLGKRATMDWMAEVIGGPSVGCLAALFRALAKNLDLHPHETETTAFPSKSITMAVGVRQIPFKHSVEALAHPIVAPPADPRPQWQPRVEYQEN